MTLHMEFSRDHGLEVNWHGMGRSDLYWENRPTFPSEKVLAIGIAVTCFTI